MHKLSSIVKSPCCVLSTIECVKGKLFGSSPVKVIVAVELTGMEIDCGKDIGLDCVTLRMIVPNGLTFTPFDALNLNKK